MPITIGDSVFIGEHTIILVGKNIGNNCIVGANSLVKSTFLDNVITAGNPTKIVCMLEEYYNWAKKE